MNKTMMIAGTLASAVTGGLVYLAVQPAPTKIGRAHV